MKKKVFFAFAHKCKLYCEAYWRGGNGPKSLIRMVHHQGRRWHKIDHSCDIGIYDFFLQILLRRYTLETRTEWTSISEIKLKGPTYPLTDWQGLGLKVPGPSLYMFLSLPLKKSVWERLANSGSNLDPWKGDINSHWRDWVPGVEQTPI